MIDNYNTTEDGVIYQVNTVPISYGKEYSAKYDKYGELSNYISYLRLGYIIAAISCDTSTPMTSLLDVGYGNGAFLSVANKTIPECYGSDISNDYKLPDGIKYVNNIIDKHYDVVTFFDVLEHFKDIDVIKELKCKYVCISLPLCHNYSDEWLLQWKHLRPNEHLWHFNGESLKVFMTRMGYQQLCCGNIEDVIRGSKYSDSNILTAVFKRV